MLQLPVRTKKKFSARELKITLAVVAALIAGIIAAVVYISNKDSIRVKQPVYFSVMGEVFEYTGTSKLTYEENRMYFTNQGQEDPIDLMSIPLYIQDQDRLKLTQVMSYSNFDPKAIGKLNYFADISMEGDVFTLSADGKRGRDVKGGYLFDGKNTYLFLEPMTVTYGEKTLELGPLSYITVVRGNYFYYYSYGDQKAGYEVFDQGQIMAVNQADTYTLNLTADLVEPADGKIQMLVPNPEVLDTFTEVRR